MELKNPLYKNIGVHVVSSIFTVDRGVVKVLLIKRTRNLFFFVVCVWRFWYNLVNNRIVWYQYES